ncbi:hypothetical protein GCM10009557_29220 [Virgisporangium ochraceum]
MDDRPSTVVTTATAAAATIATATTAAIAGAPEPSSPTSGAAAPPRPNCTAPRSTAAVPATAPWRDIARAGVFGNTRPIVATVSQSGTSMPGRPPRPVTVDTTSTSEAVAPTSIAATRIRCGGRRRRSQALSCVATTRPTAPAPKTNPNACPLSPYRSWNTKEEPAT